MNKELLAIHTETQIIKAIGERLLSQLSIQRLHLEAGDDQTYFFADGQMQAFIFHSELAYQLLFPSVDSFLQRVREFQLSVATICYETEPLVCHDAYVLQHQLILKEALETLESYRLIHEAAESESESEQLTQSEPGFIDISNPLVKQIIESIREDVSDELNRKQIHGIVNHAWLDEYLRFRAVYLNNIHDRLNHINFSKNEYAQMIDIALGRVSASYLKEAA